MQYPCRAVAALLAFFPIAAKAAESRPSEAPRELFPDQPKGLGENAIAWKFDYIGEAFGNLAGGIKQGAAFEEFVKFGVGINFEKLAGWNDTVFYTNFIYPHGEGLTQSHVSDLNVISNIDAYDSLRIYKLWIQKTFFEDRFSLRAGIMPVDKEFFGSEGAALFINSGFGTFPVIGQDIVAPVYPVSAAGVRIQWKPASAFRFRVAAFGGDAGAPEVNRHNTRFRFRAEDGVSVFTEMDYKVNADGNGLPGTYQLGGFYTSKAFDDLSDGPRHHGNYGVYAMGDQQLSRERPDETDDWQGLSAFARFAIAPEDRNLVVFDTEAGLTYKGMLPGRDDDVLGIGVVYSKLSDRARGETGRALMRHHETVLEVTYQAVINDWFILQPDLQYIFNPGAMREAEDAIVAGLRFILSF